MSIQDMKKRMMEYCDSIEWCSNCPLCMEDAPPAIYKFNGCYSRVTEEELTNNYNWMKSHLE